VSQDGRVYCWGNNVFGMLGVGDGNPRPTPAQLDLEGWSEVSVSANHACGIRAGELLCWGSNSYGQLGTGWGIVPTPLAQANDLE
jgi:alpha-tubulin suppressor-like RCC1 family protein